MVTAGVAAAADSDQVYFSSTTNVTNILVDAINHENVRIDLSSWYLSEHAISIAVANRFAAGVAVRIIGDRAAPFEIDAHTRMEYYWLASQGVPIRLRFNPTYFPEIDHWKMAIFVGQNMVEFGSGNFAPTELAPNSPTDYDDDSELFTTDPVLVNAFKTKFDVMWNDTTVEPSSIAGPPPYLKNWDEACAAEHQITGNCDDYRTIYPNPVPMVINTNRLEGNNFMPPDLIWGQGDEFNNRITREIANENSFVDLVVYRLGVDNITQALLDKKAAGVPVKVIVDTAQYNNNTYPEYWLTHSNVEKLWVAGVPILQRVHAGVTHLKTLITSTYATNASSNFTPHWQRDHDYFVPAATKPGVYQAFVANFNAMWSDTTNFAPFTPTPPAPADLANPADGAAGVSTPVTLVWNRATWATSYDVYLGTSTANMTVVANVPAQLTTDPPPTYSWTTTTPLQPGTTYFWKVVSKTFATPVNPSMIASSVTQSFTVAAGPPSVPGSPSPAAGATGVATNSTLSWSSAGASSYDVKFGTTNTPPQVATGQAAASYAPALAASTTYFWQIVAHNGVGATTGPLWSFTTAAAGGGLPSPWVSQDVGATGLAGSASFAGGVFTVNGSGGDIWGSADAFQYVEQPLAGDGQIVARLASVQNTNAFAKAGVMLRETAAAGAVHVILDVRPDGSIEFMTRQTSNGDTTYLGGATLAPPAWLKLVRAGSTVTSYASPDGTVWTAVGTTSVTMSSTALIGLIVTSHDTTLMNTSTFDHVAVSPAGPPSPPAAPGSPSPAAGAIGVATTSTLSWSSSGATSYDVKFGTSNPPPQVATGQAAASFAPALAPSTTYFWQIIARNSSGSTSGAIWSFTTAAPPPPPAAPGSPSPAAGATGVATTSTLSWSAAGATSYDVKFGTSSSPPQVTTGQAAASYAPSMAASTTYFWQIVAHNSAGATSGPVWSFTTAAVPPSPTDIVIYASDIAAAAMHGMWSVASDPTSPNGTKLVTPDNGLAWTSNPPAPPIHYVDVTFTASAGVPYTFWLRMQALNNSKFNDSVWVQFSDAQVNGAAIYPMNSTSALDVNLATDSTGSSNNAWGWDNSAYWLTQPATVTFPTSGTHTLRIQVREDGVEFDQIVLSPTTYLNTPPGPRSNDSTIVPKP
jgi:hypothetical protein